MKKTQGPCTVLEYLGLTIDTEKMLIKVPSDKIQKVLDLIEKTLKFKKSNFKAHAIVDWFFGFLYKSFTLWSSI